MHKLQRTSIEDLVAIGDELTDEHLALASGGRPKFTAKATYSNGQADGEVDINF
jgi:hypothetical protein